MADRARGFPAEVLPLLRCPLCGTGFAATDDSLRCPNGHSYDVARQGYVNLLPGGARQGQPTPPTWWPPGSRFLPPVTSRGCATSSARWPSERARETARGRRGRRRRRGAARGLHPGDRRRHRLLPGRGARPLPRPPGPRAGYLQVRGAPRGARARADGSRRLRRLECASCRRCLRLADPRHLRSAKRRRNSGGCCGPTGRSSWSPRHRGTSRSS